ncbi:hypothetical protein PCE1_000126 [Barthelona sp. PCE]
MNIFDIGFGEEDPKEPARPMVQRVPMKGHHGIVGLVNEGATCYLNTVLQCLYNVEAFRKLVFSFKPCDFGLPDDYDFDSELEQNPNPECSHPVLFQLQKLFCMMRRSDTSYVSAMDLINSFGWPPQEKLTQHDVSELLILIFDGINQVMGERSPIHHMFDLMTRRVRTCDKCPDQSITEQTTRDWRVDLGGDFTSALEALFEPSYIDDVECSACGQNAQYKMVQHLVQYPNILIITVNRFKFSYVTFNRERDGGRFEFPLEFTAPQSTIGYKLRSVCAHQGTPNSGHYTAYLRPEDGDMWYCCDDRNIRTIEDYSTLYQGNPAAYTLVYETTDCATKEKLAAYNLQDDCRVFDKLIERYNADAKKQNEVFSLRISSSDPFDFKDVKYTVNTPLSTVLEEHTLQTPFVRGTGEWKRLDVDPSLTLGDLYESKTVMNYDILCTMTDEEFAAQLSTEMEPEEEEIEQYLLVHIGIPGIESSTAFRVDDVDFGMTVEEFMNKVLDHLECPNHVSRDRYSVRRVELFGDPTDQLPPTAVLSAIVENGEELLVEEVPYAPNKQWVWVYECILPWEMITTITEDGIISADYMPENLSIQGVHDFIADKYSSGGVRGLSGLFQMFPDAPDVSFCTPQLQLLDENHKFETVAYGIEDSFISTLHTPKSGFSDVCLFPFTLDAEVDRFACILTHAFGVYTLVNVVFYKGTIDKSKILEVVNMEGEVYPFDLSYMMFNREWASSPIYVVSPVGDEDRDGIFRKQRSANASSAFVKRNRARRTQPETALRIKF